MMRPSAKSADKTVTISPAEEEKLAKLRDEKFKNWLMKKSVKDKMFQVKSVCYILGACLIMCLPFQIAS